MAFTIRLTSENDRLLITPQLAEMLYSVDSGIIYVGDGVTAGGGPLFRASLPIIAFGGAGTGATTFFSNNTKLTGALEGEGLDGGDLTEAQNNPELIVPSQAAVKAFVTGLTSGVFTSTSNNPEVPANCSLAVISAPTESTVYLPEIGGEESDINLFARKGKSIVIRNEGTDLITVASATGNPLVQEMTPNTAITVQALAEPNQWVVNTTIVNPSDIVAEGKVVGTINMDKGTHSLSVDLSEYGKILSLNAGDGIVIEGDADKTVSLKHALLENTTGNITGTINLEEGTFDLDLLESVSTLSKIKTLTAGNGLRFADGGTETQTSNTIEIRYPSLTPAENNDGSIEGTIDMTTGKHTLNLKDSAEYSKIKELVAGDGLILAKIDDDNNTGTTTQESTAIRLKNPLVENASNQAGQAVVLGTIDFTTGKHQLFLEHLPQINSSSSLIEVTTNSDNETTINFKLPTISSSSTYLAASGEFKDPLEGLSIISTTASNISVSREGDTFRVALVKDTSPESHKNYLNGQGSWVDPFDAFSLESNSTVIKIDSTDQAHRVSLDTSGVSNEYLNGQGDWQDPLDSLDIQSNVSGLSVTKSGNSNTYSLGISGGTGAGVFLNSNGSWADPLALLNPIGVMHKTSSGAGYNIGLNMPSDTATYLSGDGTWKSTSSISDMSVDAGTAIKVTKVGDTFQVSVDTQGGSSKEYLNGAGEWEDPLDGGEVLTAAEKANLEAGKSLSGQGPFLPLAGGTVTGNITVQGQVSATNFNSTSSIQYKKNVEDITDEETNKIISELRPVSFDWKHNDQRALGFIAEEVLEFLPDTVHKDGDIVQGLDYNAFIPLIIKHLQNKEAEIDDLKARIVALESK